MRQLPNPVYSSWRNVEVIAFVGFVCLFLFYVAVSVMPLGWAIEKAQGFLLETHLFPYKEYETLGGRQQILLDYYTVGAYDVARFWLPPIEWSYLQLGFVALLFSCWMALATYLERIWFWIAMGVFACASYSLSLDQLQLFGRVDHLPLLVFILPLVGVAWQMKRATHLLLGRRVMVFGAYFVLAAVAVRYFSMDETPFLTLAHHTYYLQLSVTVLFCFMVGHELPYLMLRLSSGAGFGASAPRFVVVFIIYLAHLVLFFLENTGRIDWGVGYLSEFVFLSLSAWIGIWGLRARAHQFSYLLPYPLLSINYFLMGALSFSVITYMRWSGNDPAVEVFEDMTLFGHLGFGTGFAVYVLMNFWRPLMASVAVWKMVYDAVDTPFLVVRLFGLIGVFACYALSKKVAYNHTIAGEQMHLATLHMLRAETLGKAERSVARTYYKQAAVFGYQSRGPNYALAQMEEEDRNPYEAAYYYNTARAKHPLPETYLNLGNVFYAMKLQSRALEVWREGLLRFPHDPYLSNSLSFYYLQQQKWDSVSYYVDRAPLHTIINRWAMYAVRAMPLDASDLSKAEPLLQQFAQNNRLGLPINYLAIALRTETEAAHVLDTTAYTSAYGLPYTHNYLLKELRMHPRRLLNLVDSMEEVHLYPELAHDAQRLRAFAAQALLQTDRALRTLDPLLVPGSQYEGFYAYVSGLWAYSVGGYSRAVDYFLRAYPRGYEEGLALGLLSTSLLPNGPLKERQIEAWRRAGADTSSLWARYVVEAPFADLDEGSLAQFEELLEASEVSDELVGLMLQRLLDEERIDLAEALWERYPMPLSEGLSYADLLYAELKLAIHLRSATGPTDLQRNRWPELPSTLPHRTYFDYLHSPGSVSADRLAEVARAYPFQQHLLCAVAEVLKKDGHPLIAYDVLHAALETNPYGYLLQSEYILYALDLGQDQYAEAGRADLRALVSQKKYASFLKKYTAALVARRAEDDSW